MINFKINYIKPRVGLIPPHRASSVLPRGQVGGIFAGEPIPDAFVVDQDLFADLLDDAPKTPCEVEENKE